MIVGCTCATVEAPSHKFPHILHLPRNCIRVGSRVYLFMWLWCRAYWTFLHSLYSIVLRLWVIGSIPAGQFVRIASTVSNFLLYFPSRVMFSTRNTPARYIPCTGDPSGPIESRSTIRPPWLVTLLGYLWIPWGLRWETEHHVLPSLSLSGSQVSQSACSCVSTPGSLSLYRSGGHSGEERVSQTAAVETIST